MRKLWLDLGNTRLKYWLTENGKVIAHDAEQHLQAPAELLIGFSDRFAQYAPDFIGVSSVLGKTLNANITRTLKKLKIPFKMVSVDNNHVLMSSDYDPHQLGVDRWLQMLAVADEYDKLCVIGCGTALTIDVIENKHHQGGYIFPSIYLQREALQSGTRQISIPENEFENIYVGQTTSDAVHRGILLSIVGAVQYVMQTHENFQMIMTGGDAGIIAQHIAAPIIIRDDLLLQGIQAYFGK